MIASTMAAPKKSPAKKPPTPTVAAARADGRPKSKLSQHGDQAKLEAERALLLATLEAKGWNLTHTARELAMTDASAVLRGIDRYGLRTEYEKHRV